MNLEEKQQKLNQVYVQLIEKFDQLYEKYKFNVLIYIKKMCKQNYKSIKGDRSLRIKNITISTFE